MNNLVIRHFFALPPMNAPSDGHPTNAIYGSLKSLQQLLKLFKPSRVVLCWDGGRQSWRRRVYADYKKRQGPRVTETRVDDGEQRHELLPGISGSTIISESLGYQFRVLEDVLGRIFNFPQLRVKNVEADDLISVGLTLLPDTDRVIVSTDHDFLQLVDSRVTVFDPLKTEWVKLSNFETMMEKYPNYRGVKLPDPTMFLDFMIINGDTGDGVPMVKGLSGRVRFGKYIEDFTKFPLSAALADDTGAGWMEAKARWQRETYEKLDERFDELYRNWQLVDLRYARTKHPEIRRLPVAEQHKRLERVEVWEMLIRYGMKSLVVIFEEWIKEFEAYQERL